jgi:hypothetical protein
MAEKFGMGAILGQLNSPPGTQIPFEIVIFVLAHSMAVGFVQVMATYYLSKWLKNLKSMGGSGKTTAGNVQKLILGSANTLFLCVGLTGVMLLINNNLIRAFAIVAAIALVRFRVPLTQRSLNSSLLFGILAGMACGVQELTLAWTITGIYIVLMIGVYLVIRLVSPKSIPKPIPAVPKEVNP